MIYTSEEVQKMLKLWAAYREFDEGESIRLGCGSPTYAAMMHAMGYIRQQENCRTVFTPPSPPEYHTLIGQALDALWECPSLQYIVGRDKDKYYTQARMLVSVLRRRYCYGMSIRRIGGHVGLILRGDGKGRASNDKVEGLLGQAETFICDYLNKRIKSYEIVTKNPLQIGYDLV